MRYQRRFETIRSIPLPRMPESKRVREHSCRGCPSQTLNGPLIRRLSKEPIMGGGGGGAQSVSAQLVDQRKRSFFAKQSKGRAGGADGRVAQAPAIPHCLVLQSTHFSSQGCWPHRRPRLVQEKRAPDLDRELRATNVQLVSSTSNVAQTTTREPRGLGTLQVPCGFAPGLSRGKTFVLSGQALA